ncbi:hypothetical protein [Lysobacter sp. H23M47]|uniref:hypothetical protein n=1 Tax=Lysobacter sp. H23M47 TaxID=2781024 RepID=UPI0018810A6E|nr:hypothetical protein [Lysobacter sp. H23M47]QOW24784.1 hypothetical protein INQ43_01485 [Lysobacter sp. H23M47]
MELTLVLAPVALYLHDSMMLMHYDEVAFLQTGTGWKTSIGADAPVLRRHPLIPNPLTPARATFRLSWLAGNSADDKEHWAGVRHLVAALGSLKPACNTMLVLLFVVLPLLLWRYPHPLALLALLLLIYLCGSAIACQLWRYRRVFGLDGRTVIAWGFEALVCPPLAINMVRKICLRRSLQAHPIAAARQLCDPAGEAILRGQVNERLSTALSLNHEGDPQHGALLACRQRLNGTTR